MTNARPQKSEASALDQRRNRSTTKPRPDVAQAVADIRAACATIVRLARLDASGKEVR